MLSSAYWLGVADRAVKSFAQALLLLWGADAGFNLLAVDIPSALGIAAGAAVLSVLTSLVSLPIGDRGSPSVLPGAS